LAEKITRIFNIPYNDSIENYEGGGFAKVELANYQPLIDFVAAKTDTPVSAEKE